MVNLPGTLPVPVFRHESRCEPRGESANNGEERGVEPRYYPQAPGATGAGRSPSACSLASRIKGNGGCDRARNLSTGGRGPGAACAGTTDRWFFAKRSHRTDLLAWHGDTDRIGGLCRASIRVLWDGRGGVGARKWGRLQDVESRRRAPVPAAGHVRDLRAVARARVVGGTGSVAITVARGPTPRNGHRGAAGPTRRTGGRRAGPPGGGRRGPGRPGTRRWAGPCSSRGN